MKKVCTLKMADLFSLLCIWDELMRTEFGYNFLFVDIYKVSVS